MDYLLLIFVSFLGGSLVFIPEIKRRFKLPAILSFSGSFLLSICFLHIFPELFHVEDVNLGLYLMIGFFLQLTLDYFSGGIEHGHTHVHTERIGHFPWLVLFSLCLHAFLEAMPLEHFGGGKDEHALLTGLLIHKLPISFILANLLMAYELNKVLIGLGILLFSLSAPLGMWIGGELIAIEAVFSKLMAVSAGIILHLSTTILLEGNEGHKIQWKKLYPMLLGASLALLSLL